MTEAQWDLKSGAESVCGPYHKVKNWKENVSCFSYVWQLCLKVSFLYHHVSPILEKGQLLNDVKSIHHAEDNLVFCLDNAPPFSPGDTLPVVT